MMKYTTLRLYMKNIIKISTMQGLEDSALVIDGENYFNDSYKSSKLEFVNGAECDKYAQYLRNKLRCFVKRNVKCYVIFNGSTNTDCDNTQKAHQSIINDRSNDKLLYFEPAFVKDVQREVLDELEIKYFHCESDYVDAIVTVARKFKCPVLSDNIEYCFYGVSCIPPKSMMILGHDDDMGLCRVYGHAAVKSIFGVYDKTPLFLTLLNENGSHFGNLAEIIECEDQKLVACTLRWVKKQRKEGLRNVIKKLDNETDRKEFMILYEKIYLLCNFSQGTLAVKHFLRDEPYVMYKYDKKWFCKGVSNGRIAAPYIDLMKNAMFTGSHLMFDANKPDAMLAAIDIISFNFILLTNSQKSEFTLIARQFNSCCAVTNETQWECKISNWPIFTERKGGKNRFNPKLNLVEEFLSKKLPCFNMKDLISIPERCRALVISLVYYVRRVNKDFAFGAHCLLLSYVLLGPVAEVIKMRSESITTKPIEDSQSDFVADYVGLEYEDCQTFSKALERFFKPPPLSQLDRGLLHTFAEFQHCLQHMNYLIRLCDKSAPPCTVYHKTYNGTFVYNLYLSMKCKGELMRFLECQFKSGPVLQLYKNIVNCFESFLG